MPIHCRVSALRMANPEHSLRLGRPALAGQWPRLEIRVGEQHKARQACRSSLLFGAKASNSEAEKNCPRIAQSVDLKICSFMLTIRYSRYPSLVGPAGVQASNLSYGRSVFDSFRIPLRPRLRVQHGLPQLSKTFLEFPVAISHCIHYSEQYVVSLEHGKWANE